MEWLVEKMTEVGVNRIIPILTDRSERRELKVERLVKIAVSAMKQSLKTVLPEITPLTPLREVTGMMAGAQRFVAYCDPAVERVDLARAYRPATDTLLLIGPEGDFTLPRSSAHSAPDSGPSLSAKTASAPRQPHYMPSPAATSSTI